jgi:hypothetical protein
MTSMRLPCICSLALILVGFPLLAQQQSERHHIRYGPGVCGPADPTYIRTAEESGGQPLFLAPDEVAKSFSLVSELTRQNRVTLLWARGDLTRGHEFLVPVDSSVQRVTFSLSFNTAGGKLAVVAPNGKEVAMGAPGVKITDLNCGRIVTVSPPSAGRWRAKVSGKGRFWLETSGVSDIFLVEAEFVRLGGRPAHEGYFRIPGQPVVGEPAFLRVDLSGKTRKVHFQLISPEAAPLKPIFLKMDSSSRDEAEYFGRIDLPAGPFRLEVTGADESGHPFQRVFSTLFHAEMVEVIPLEAGLEELPAGKASTLHFRIRNAGAAREFSILIVDTKNFLSNHQAQIVSLAAGESRELPVELSIPASMQKYARDTVIVTVTATSGPATSNSAVTEFTIDNSPAH